MPNMNPKKLPAREQAPEVRSHNFEEVSQGYDEAMGRRGGRSAACTASTSPACPAARSTCASRSFWRW